jgi:hypothetical protein
MKLTIEDNPETIKRYGHLRPAPPWGSVRCSAKCPGTTRTCTRERGHRGPHVTHGTFRKVVAVWDSGAEGRSVEPTRSSRKLRRSRGGSAPRAPQADGWLGSLKAFWGALRRITPSMEEVLLIALGLTMAWFAVDTALRIMGWK